MSLPPSKAIDLLNAAAAIATVGLAPAPLHEWPIRIGEIEMARREGENIEIRLHDLEHPWRTLSEEPLARLAFLLDLRLSVGAGGPPGLNGLDLEASAEIHPRCLLCRIGFPAEAARADIARLGQRFLAMAIRSARMAEQPLAAVMSPCTRAPRPLGVVLGTRRLPA